MRFIKTLAPAILAGVMIAFGGVVALSVENTVAAAILGSIGILAVLAFDMSLFTEKAESLLDGGRSVSKNLCKTLWSLFGNVVGAAIFGFLFSVINDTPVTFYSSMPEVKEMFILMVRSVFGGMALYIALHGYRRLSGDFSGSLVAVSAFAASELCGFAFAVTETFRYAAAQIIHWRAAVYIVLIAIGNLAGVLVTAWAHSLRNIGE